MQQLHATIAHVTTAYASPYTTEFGCAGKQCFAREGRSLLSSTALLDLQTGVGPSREADRSVRPFVVRPPRALNRQCRFGGLKTITFT